MSVVVIQGASWVQGSQYIGYDNLYLRLGAVAVASAEDAGFPASNATRWPTYGGGWQSSVVATTTLTVTLLSAENANSYGVYKHNLGDIGATVKLQSSSDGISWTDLAGSEKTPGDNKAIFFVNVTPVSAKFWRIHIVGLGSGETLKIGHAFVGNSLRVFSPPLPGWTPPNLAKNDDYINSRSDGGEFLGRSLIRKGNRTGFQIQNVLEGWVRANWEPLLDAIQEHPFYHAWDVDAHPNEVAYCYTEGKLVRPQYEFSGFFSISLNFIALIE